MKRWVPGLAGWLAIVTAVLVTVSVASVSIVGVRLLRDLAEAEALTRVELGVSSAREFLRQELADLQTSAKLLAARPTLQQLLGAADIAALGTYLGRYCDDAALDACAIVRGSEIVIAVGTPAPWQEIAASANWQGEQFLVAATTPLTGARAPLVSSDAQVLAVRYMDDRFVIRLSEGSGLQLQIVDAAAAADADADDPLKTLIEDALTATAAVAGRFDALRSYVAALPVRTASGEPVLMLQAILPHADVMAPVSALEGRMLLIALLVALLSTVSGVLIGRGWIRGVQRLTRAAHRIGAGDLNIAIPGEAGAEISVLASTMEEMRRNLLILTDEIRRREAQAQAVLGGIVEGVFAVDRKRRMRFLNPRAEKLLSISHDDAFGRFCGDVLRPVVGSNGRRPCDYDCPIVRARDGGSAESVEHIETQKGQLRRAVVSSAAASDGIQVQVLRDETELEAARRTRDTVLANISHEFRTPLAAQLASIELLRDGIGDMSRSAQKQLVASLERGVHRLTWLIDNLLESVRIESGQLSIRRTTVNLTDIVRNARDLIEPLIVQRSQKLEVRSVPAIPEITGDRQRLVQVLVNLLANASKFAPPGSLIRIGAETPNSCTVQLWVEDEGTGPTDPADSRLFEAFRRSDGEDPEESGLGLGLFIVKSIIERHGGRVWIARTDEAHTRATIEVPIDGGA